MDDEAREVLPDVFTVIEDMRANERISPADWAEIERERDIFFRNIALTPPAFEGVLGQAFRFGCIIGGYVGAFDGAPEARRHSLKVQQHLGGDASGKARRAKGQAWREHAKHVWLEISAAHPSMLKKTLYAEVCDQLKKAGFVYGADSTVKTYILRIEKDINSPKR